MKLQAVCGLLHLRCWPGIASISSTDKWMSRIRACMVIGGIVRTRGFQGWYREGWYLPYISNLMRTFAEPSLTHPVEIPTPVSCQPCTLYKCAFCSVSSFTGINLVRFRVKPKGLWGRVPRIHEAWSKLLSERLFSKLMCLKMNQCAGRAVAGIFMECVHTINT